MHRLEISTTAKNDLISIWIYIAENSSQDIANRFIDKLEKSLTTLAATPELGTDQKHVKEGLKRFIFKSYSIYYNIEDAEVIVIRRVWHQKRDLENISII